MYFANHLFCEAVKVLSPGCNFELIASRDISKYKEVRFYCDDDGVHGDLLILEEEQPEFRFGFFINEFAIFYPNEDSPLYYLKHSNKANLFVPKKNLVLNVEPVIGCYFSLMANRLIKKGTPLTFDYKQVKLAPGCADWL